MNNRLGRIGVWSLELRFGDPMRAAEAAAEVEELGFGALWIPGGVGGDLLQRMESLLAATETAVVASGILNIWKHEPEAVATWWKGLARDDRDRTLLGLGVSHPHSIGEVWRKPLEAMRDYLLRLSTAGVPGEAACLAALGPKMLELARDLSAGAHPYLVTPAHTALARETLGPGKLLAPQQGVVLEADPARARELARRALTQYQTYPNYVNSWRRLGFSPDEISGGSDRLVDALFAWGTIEQIVERIDEHFAAGADHVCLQVVTGAGLDIAAARPAWRALAEGVA